MSARRQLFHALFKPNSVCVSSFFCFSSVKTPHCIPLLAGATMKFAVLCRSAMLKLQLKLGDGAMLKLLRQQRKQSAGEQQQQKKKKKKKKKNADVLLKLNECAMLKLLLKLRDCAMLKLGDGAMLKLLRQQRKQSAGEQQQQQQQQQKKNIANVVPCGCGQNCSRQWL